jgi:hypothetical protein
MIYSAFASQLGRESLFADVDTIPPGANFRKILKEWVDQCDALLALIGPEWIDAKDPATGCKLLENPSDFVRIEIGVKWVNESSSRCECVDAPKRRGLSSNAGTPEFLPRTKTLTLRVSTLPSPLSFEEFAAGLGD